MLLQQCKSSIAECLCTESHVIQSDVRMHLQAVRRSKEAFKLQEDAQYSSSPFLPNQKVP